MKIIRNIESRGADNAPVRQETTGGWTKTLGDQTLIKLVLNAVQTVRWPRGEEELKTRYECQPRMLLTLLVYCYASGTYGSKQIQQATRENTMARYICAKEFPDERIIRKFRKENRLLVKQCLNAVFQQAWALKFDQAEADFLGFDWFESVLKAQIHSETADRIDLAIFMDVMQWDLED